MKKRRFSAKFAVFMFAVIIAALYLVYEFFGGKLLFNSGNMIMVETGASIQYDSGSRAVFFPRDDRGVFFCTKDGLKYYSSDGGELASHTFSMTLPLIVGEGGYAAVFEHKGKSLYVYSASELMYSKNIENPILSVALNSSGYSGVITSRGDAYEIFVYNPSGSLVKKYVFDEPAVSPAACDISDDGRILAVSFLNYGISNREINSEIVFMYINQSEAMDHEDGIFASLPNNGGEYIGIIKFMGGGRLLSVSDKNIFMVDAENECRKLWAYELGNKLDSIAFLSGKGFAIAFGEQMVNAQSEPAGAVKFYDLSLKLMAELSFDTKIEALYPGFDAVIVQTSSSLTAVRFDGGSRLWAYNPTDDVRQAMFVDNTQTLLTASGREAKILKLGKAKETEALQ